MPSYHIRPRPVGGEVAAGMSNELSEEQNDAVQEFLTTFNKIEAALKHRMKRDSKDRFMDVLREARLFVGTSDFELLTSVAELRNVLVYAARRPYDYVAVPRWAIVDQLKKICERMLHPECVFQSFRNR